MDQMQKREPKNSLAQIFALALLGVGLLVLGGVAWIALPGLLGAPVEVEEPASLAPAPVSFAAPSLELTDLQGNPVSLQNMRGRYTLVNHWATWCPPCKAEMPTLQAYYEDHRDSGFTIVAIDAGETADVVANYVQGHGLTFPVWADPEQKGMDAFNETYLPSSYLIDPNGQVVLYWGGGISRAMLDKYLTPLLEKTHGSEG
jgi:cytochrome c biogenesis protein CcmG, thiol:disulfide interchange protein DsbE